MTVVIESSPLAPAEVTSADAALVRRARQGDSAAQHELFVQHAPAVTRLLRKLLGREVDAEDGVQHCFLMALEHLDELERPERFRQWVLSIATRHARRAFLFDRLRRFVCLAPQDDGPLWDARDLAGGLMADERAQLVLAGRRLARLPLGLREPWVLRFVEGCTLEEVAEVGGYSLATAKRRLAEAQHRLEGTKP